MLMMTTCCLHAEVVEADQIDLNNYIHNTDNSETIFLNVLTV
jgi:hypothetical protein